MRLREPLRNCGKKAFTCMPDFCRSGNGPIANAFTHSEVMEQSMNQVIVLGGTAALLAVLANRGQRDGSRGRDHLYTDRSSFEQFELAANNLKTAARKVDRSAAAVEVALKALTPASLARRQQRQH